MMVGLAHCDVVDVQVDPNASSLHFGSNGKWQHRRRGEDAPAFLVAQEPVRDGLTQLQRGNQMTGTVGKARFEPDVPLGGRVGQPQTNQKAIATDIAHHAALTACDLVFGAQHEELPIAGIAPSP